MSAASDLKFLRKFQRLLSEGEFVATYKFALLQALADLSVEQPIHPAHDKGLVVPVTSIAEKFIEYYWRQAVPYAPNLEQEGILRQNTGRQAAVINSIAETRGQYSNSIHQVKRNEREWKRLRHRVTTTIDKQPLWKLQVVGRNIDEAAVLGDVFESSGLSHDAERSRFVAVWSYEQGEQSRVHTYLKKDDYPTLDRSWRGILV